MRNILRHFATLLDNPWYRRDVIFARLIGIAASMLWGLIVVTHENALEIVPYSKPITVYVNENIIGGFYVCNGAILLWRIIFKLPPRSIGALGYGAIVLGLGSVATYLWFVQTPILPAATAMITPVLFAAIYGFVSNPTRTRRHAEL